MTGIIYPNASTNAFTYNGLSKRVAKTDSTGTFAYTLTDDAIDSAILSDGAATYRQAVGMVGEVRGGNKSYYNADALGSTRTVADNAGTVSATRETDAFGNVWALGTTGTLATPFGFAGQHGYQTDADSGLMRLGHHYYDASTGRFLSRDPIRDGYNWYAYCENDPVNDVDPEGLQAVIPVGQEGALETQRRAKELLKKWSEESRGHGDGKPKDKPKLDGGLKGEGEKGQPKLKEAKLKVVLPVNLP